MKIGTPKEIKIHEYRIGLTPSSVKELSLAGHEIMIQQNAGAQIGYTDKMYQDAGAIIAQTAKEVFDWADMIVKVKEPLESEYTLLRENQILFTYFHFAASKELTVAMMKSGAVCIAYETVPSPPA